MAESTETLTVTEQRRDTIRQAVGTLADDIMANIAALRHQLDDLEALVLANAARVSANLNEHVEVCGSVSQEVARIAGVVAELRRGQQGQTELLNGAAPTIPVPTTASEAALAVE